MIASWHLQPIFNSYALVAAVLLALLLLLLLPAFRKLKPARRRTLFGLRLLALALLGLAMLRPTHISTLNKRQSAVLLLLLDKSRSMQLPNATGDLSRWEAQRELLRSAEPLLQELAGDLQVKVYVYDEQLQPVDARQDRLQLPSAPDGQQTDIGTSLYEAVSREHGQRLAGVILLGDGAQTAFAPKVDLAEAGRELNRLGYPLYTISFGPAAEVAQSRDLAIEQLPEQYTVFVKNELRVRALLRVLGYVNQDLPVEMLIEKPDGQQQVFGPLQVRAQEDGQQVPVEMSFTPSVAGAYRLTLRAEEQPGELVFQNNQLSAYVTVLEGGLRVLYLEGEHRNESRFLRRALDASPDIQVSFDLFEKSTRDQWPVNLGPIWEEDQYDVFILGDLDATALGDENLGRLAAAVDGGKGLMLLGGAHSYGPGGYRETPLEDAIPITMGRFERQDFEGPFRKDLHLSEELQMLAARPHPVVSLAADADNAAAWKRLPRLRGGNKFAGLKESPGIQVIGESSDGRPLLVAAEYGRGRVLASAVDSTWLWAMRGFGDEHRRFWRQCILWLVRREDIQQDDVWVKLPQRRYRLGSRVPFRAGLKQAASSATRPEVRFEAQLKLPDGSRQEIPLIADDGEFMGTIAAAQQAGDYLLQVTASSPQQSLGSGEAAFQVLDEDIELSNPAADPDQLARLAEMTREFGGRLLAAEQLLPLLRDIQQQPPKLEIAVQTKWQLGGTAGSAWPLLLAFVLVVTGEWALRKKWGLV